MINKLADDLIFLEKKQNQQTKLLNNLYLYLQEIAERKQYLSQPFRPNINLLDQVRPEVMYQVLEYIDFKTFMKFRLVSRRCNQIILLTLNKKIIKINDEIELLQLDLEYINKELELVKDDKTTQDQIIEAAKQQLTEQLSLVQLSELRSYARPPQICFRVCEYLLAFIYPNLDEKQDKWQVAKQLLHSANFVGQFISININEIKESQWSKLATINEINQMEVANISQAAACIFNYIRTVQLTRQSSWYLKNNEQKKLMQNIKNKNLLIKLLKNINKN